MHSQIWILKNKATKFEKHRDEVIKNCEILTEEVTYINVLVYLD